MVIYFEGENYYIGICIKIINLIFGYGVLFIIQKKLIEFIGALVS